MGAPASFPVSPRSSPSASPTCAATNATETAVVEAALRLHLDGTSDRTLLFRRLDRLGRAVERSHRDLELLSEAFGGNVSPCPVVT